MSQFAIEIAAIIGIFYFLMVRPMQNQKKARVKMLEELKTGDMVVTSGGIVGSITSIDPDSVVLRVKPDNLKLQFSRASISSLWTPPSGESSK
jgi:preprotein translocase subunit YajC